MLVCGQPCDGYQCYSCTCPKCGVILLIRICINCTYGDGKPVTCCECEGPLRGGFCLFCNSKDKNSYTFDPNAYSFNETSSNFNLLPQPQFKTYLCNLCGNNSHDGYDYQQQLPFVYEQEPSYNQNYNDNYYPYDLPSCLCCDNCEGEQKKNIKDTMLELVEVCRQKKLYCMHNDVDDLIESALNSKLLSINLDSQRLDKEKHEVKNIIEQLTKEHEYSLSMGYEYLNTTPKTESDEIIKSGVEKHLPIPSEYEVTSDDKNECDVPVCENSPVCDDHFEILSDSNNDDISSDDDAFENVDDHTEETRSGSTTGHADNSLPEYDSFCFEIEPNSGESSTSLKNTSQISLVHAIAPILPTEEHEYSLSISDDDAFENVEYVKATPLDPELVSLEEENDVYQEDEEFDLEDIQDVILREKLLSINLLITNIESLNDNPTPDRMFNSSTLIPIF
nr:hypothetical protein [Tanacetum cinerariifolium]